MSDSSHNEYYFKTPIDIDVRTQKTRLKHQMYGIGAKYPQVTYHQWPSRVAPFLIPHLTERYPFPIRVKIKAMISNWIYKKFGFL